MTRLLVILRYVFDFVRYRTAVRKEMFTPGYKAFLSTSAARATMDRVYNGVSAITQVPLTGEASFQEAVAASKAKQALRTPPPVVGIPFHPDETMKPGKKPTNKPF